ncbi:hypothetical protein MKX03_004969, partial [Papaver bracteatum]
MDTKKRSFFVLLFVFALCSKPHNSIAADIIAAGASLSGFQTISSKGGNFMMGLFTPGNSQYHYLGIWYNYDRVPERTVVWVANRDRPLNNSSSSEFKLLENGNLVLYDNYLSEPSIYFTNRSPIWSTNSASSNFDTAETVLGDDGNLVLRDKSNPSVVIWQSFDYPTDTWLPGMKIGLNSKTYIKLTSWRNQEDPAIGIFSLELDSTGIRQYLIKWNNSVKVWKSGEWNEQNKTFTSVPEMNLNYIFNYSYILNENNSYFIYNLYNTSIISRLVMDIYVQVKLFTWSHISKRWNLFWSQPKQLCEVYGICGHFGNCKLDAIRKCECLPGFVEQSLSDWDLQDSTGGCLRNKSFQCGSKDVFSPIPTSNLPDNPKSSQVNSTEQCKSACLNNCSCNAYAYTDSGCQLWEGDMLNMKQQSDGRAGNLYLRGAVSEIHTE